MKKNRGIFLLIFLLQLACVQLRAQSNIDSLTALLPSAQGKQRVDVLNELVKQVSRYDFETAMRYSRESLRLSGEINYGEGYLESLLMMAMSYNVRGDFDSSLVYAKQVLENPDAGKKALARANNMTGLLYTKKNEHQKALEYLLTGVKLADEIGDISISVRCQANIGLVYMELHQFERAILNFRKVLLLAGTPHLSSPNLSLVYSNIASCYGALNQLDSVFYYGEKGAEIARGNNDLVTYANILNIMGTAHYARKDYKKALEVLLQAKDVREKVNDPYYLVSDYTTIGDLYLKTNDYAAALAYGKKALHLADSNKLERKYESIYRLLATSYEKLGNKDKSIFYLNLLIAQKDSTYSNASSEAFAEMQTKYETARQEKANLELSNEVRKKQNILYLLLVFSAVAILLTYLLFARYKLAQRAKLAEEIRMQEMIRFRQTLEAEENERSRIAKELHDGLGQLLAAARINISVLEEAVTDDEDLKFVKNSQQFIDEAATEVRTISHNLMPAALIEKGLEPVLRDQVSRINDAKKVLVSLHTALDQRLPQNTEITLYRITQEILNNMLKHAGASEIKISLVSGPGEVELTVEDNGKGFDLSLIAQSKGIGWKNIYSRAAVIQGTVLVDSREMQGTTVRVKVPLHDR